MIAPYLLVAAILFSVGALGFLTRRNMITMFLSAEMMLQGVALNLITFERIWGNWEGQIFAIFVLTVAAAEAGIALALIVSLYRSKATLDVSVWQELREPGEPASIDPEEPAAEPQPQRWPKLTPAGIEPEQGQEERVGV